MSYLVDTNVVSELRKGARADRRVMDWFRQRRDDELFLSVLTVGELRRGAVRLRRRDPKAADAVGAWVDRIVDRFSDRMLDVDRAVGERWGHSSALDPVPDVDGLLAATAFAHDLIVVTRNMKHIAPTGVRCFDPFGRLGEPPAG